MKLYIVLDKLDKDVTDLPEPDSPTIPTVSPLLRVKLTSFEQEISTISRSLKGIAISNNASSK